MGSRRAFQSHVVRRPYGENIRRIIRFRSASGGLIASFNEGIFDGLAYGMHGLFGFRNIKKDSTPKKESYYDYQKRKHANKKPVGHLVFVGLSFVFVGVVFFLISLAI